VGFAIREPEHLVTPPTSDINHRYSFLGRELRDVDVGDALRRLQRGQPLEGRAAEKRDLIGELYGLWFGRESMPGRPHEGVAGRPTRDFVYSGMLVHAMNAPDGLTFEQALRLHPSVFPGVQQGARGADAMLEGRPWSERQSRYTPGVTPEMHRDARIEREVETFKAWFRTLPEPMLDHSASPQEVERYVYAQLRAHFAR
jgi:hypothetical protein